MDKNAAAHIDHNYPKKKKNSLHWVKLKLTKNSVSKSPEKKSPSGKALEA